VVARRVCECHGVGQALAQTERERFVAQALSRLSAEATAHLLAPALNPRN
jgi:hypothetical protein